jgi:hypothetical protein
LNWSHISVKSTVNVLAGADEGTAAGADRVAFAIKGVAAIGVADASLVNAAAHPDT